jgi:hypothetical protein
MAEEGTMTEHEIELRVERAMDALDRRLMNGSISQVQYDLKVKELDAWAEKQYQQRRF